MVCMGVNTTSGFSLLTWRATHGSRALVGPETFAHGRSGSIRNCRSSLISIVTACRRATASTSRAAYRLMPSWCSSRV